MNVKLMGADQPISNSDGTHYKSAKQCSAKRSRLYKLVVYVPSGKPTLYLWLFDLTAGSAASAAPISVLACPNGFTTTLDFEGSGSLFNNGIYLALSTVEPTDPTTVVTDAGDDAAIVKADIRIG